jgi:hypothetical protein
MSGRDQHSRRVRHTPRDGSMWDVRWRAQDRCSVLRYVRDADLRPHRSRAVLVAPAGRIGTTTGAFDVASGWGSHCASPSNEPNEPNDRSVACHDPRGRCGSCRLRSTADGRARRGCRGGILVRDEPSSEGEASSTPTTRRPTTTQRATTTSGSTRPTAHAQDFSIEYPHGWQIDKLDVVPPGTAYLDTTIKRDLADPHYVVRVDVLPNGSARGTADDAIRGLRDRSGFVLLRNEPTTLYTASAAYAAVLVEFLLDHPDSGMPLHTVDVFFEDDSGRVFAILTRAPTSDWYSWEPTFESVRSSVEVH